MIGTGFEETTLGVDAQQNWYCRVCDRKENESAAAQGATTGVVLKDSAPAQKKGKLDVIAVPCELTELGFELTARRVQVSLRRDGVHGHQAQRHGGVSGGVVGRIVIIHMYTGFRIEPVYGGGEGRRLELGSRKLVLTRRWKVKDWSRLQEGRWAAYIMAGSRVEPRRQGTHCIQTPASSSSLPFFLPWIGQLAARKCHNQPQ